MPAAAALVLRRAGLAPLRRDLPPAVVPHHARRAAPPPPGRARDGAGRAAAGVRRGAGARQRREAGALPRRPRRRSARPPRRHLAGSARGGDGAPREGGSRRRRRASGAPTRAGLARIARERPRRGRALVLFLGSNVGNFEPARASRFLRDVRSALRPGDGFLLGADLVKPEKDLLLAYDDPLGRDGGVQPQRPRAHEPRAGSGLRPHVLRPPGRLERAGGARGDVSS